MNLSIKELNELIYSLGITASKGIFVNKELNASLIDKLYSELNAAKKIGKDNFKKRMEREAKASDELGGDPKYRDLGIKHFKTNRSQWFD